jgi:hypothetical protein
VHPHNQEAFPLREMAPWRRIVTPGAGKVQEK